MYNDYFSAIQLNKNGGYSVENKKNLTWIPVSFLAIFLAANNLEIEKLLAKLKSYIG